MIFLDSSFLIANILNRDQWHERAVELDNDFKDTKKVISNIIIIETLNLLYKKLDTNYIKDIYYFLINNFSIVMTDKQIYDDAILKHL